MKKEYKEPFFEIFRLEITDDLLDESGETPVGQAGANSDTGDDTGMDSGFFDD